MAGPDPRAPLSIAEDPEALRSALEGDVRGTRVGWLGDLGGHLPMEPGVLDVCEGTLRALEGLGCAVEPAGLGFPPERIWDAWRVLRAAQVGAALLPVWREPLHRELMKPEARWEVEEGLRLSAYDVAAAQAVRGEWYAAVLRLFERHDVLVLPTAQVFPFPVETHWPREVAGRAMDTYHRWMEVVIPATMSGCPVLAAPAGFGPEGLPMGVQLWGPMRAERALLRLARALEEATGWTERVPPPALRAG